MYEPVLFAALLNHWEHKGPAEITAKRTFTYRYAQWTAERNKIALQFPNEHPFNPLPYLRLSVALDNEPEAVKAIFEFIWQSGRSLGQAETFAELCTLLGVADPQSKFPVAIPFSPA